MNPKLKEALSYEYKKDEETERILTFIADFIKDYGYHLTYDKAIKIKCNFFLRGQKYNRKRIKENTIELYISGTDISRTITTTFSKMFFVELLKKEGADVSDFLNYSECYKCSRMEIKFDKI